MKQKMILVLIAMAMGIYFTFPNEEEVIYVNQGAVTVTPIVVKIEGEVNLPGTYYLFDETSVYDCLQMAGGLTAFADMTSISLSEVITINQTITIASITGDTNEDMIQVNVNEANFAELIDVPYISESMAAYIIMYREEHGDFQTLDALVNVKYIGAATLEKIKPYLKLS